MKNLTLKKQESFLNFVTNGFFAHETQYMCAKDKREEIKSQFSKIDNKNILMEAWLDTSIFRNEMEILQHDYAGVIGSNYDKMLVKFRGHKFIINDREGFIVRFNNKTLY